MEETEEVKETTQETAETQTQETTTEETTTRVEETEGREPGGDTPAEIRARKEYRKGKRLEQEAEALRRQIAERDGQIAALKEVRTEKKEEKIFTRAELQAAVDAGTISAVQKEQYIDERLAPHELKQALRQQREEEEKQRPVLTAAQKIEEYKTLIPTLADKSSPEYRKVAEAYRTLRRDFGAAEGLTTELLALKDAFGTPDAIKKRQEMQNTDREAARFHGNERPGGGGTPQVKSDWSKASKDQIAMWEKLGTTPEQRAKEWVYIQARGKAA